MITNSSTAVYIGLGANLGEPQRQIQLALEMLTSQLGPLQLSSLYQTRPLGDANQPDFLNMAVMATTHLGTKELMNLLLSIEVALGRQRQQKNAPRLIDLDLLLYGTLWLQTPHLVLPHPQLHQRDFVLQPLLDLNPQLLHPTRMQPLQTLLQQCQERFIRAAVPFTF